MGIKREHTIKLDLQLTRRVETIKINRYNKDVDIIKLYITRASSAIDIEGIDAYLYIMYDNKPLEKLKFTNMGKYFYVELPFSCINRIGHYVASAILVRHINQERTVLLDKIRYIVHE